MPCGDAAVKQPLPRETNAHPQPWESVPGLLDEPRASKLSLLYPTLFFFLSNELEGNMLSGEEWLYIFSKRTGFKILDSCVPFFSSPFTQPTQHPALGIGLVWKYASLIAK